MDLPKEFLRQYVFVVAVNAVNAGMMDELLAAKIKAYDPETFASILSFREKELEARSHYPEQFFDSSYYKESAASVRHIASNLASILGKQS